MHMYPVSQTLRPQDTNLKLVAHISAPHANHYAAIKLPLTLAEAIEIEMRSEVLDISPRSTTISFLQNGFH